MRKLELYIKYNGYETAAKSCKNNICISEKVPLENKMLSISSKHLCLTMCGRMGYKKKVKLKHCPTFEKRKGKKERLEVTQNQKWEQLLRKGKMHALVQIVELKNIKKTY